MFKIIIGVFILILATIELYTIFKDVRKWWLRRKIKTATISKEFYCDALESGGGCIHCKETFCQYKENCSRKHPNE